VTCSETDTRGMNNLNTEMTGDKWSLKTSGQDSDIINWVTNHRVGKRSICELHERVRGVVYDSTHDVYVVRRENVTGSLQIMFMGGPCQWGEVVG
jgi:hypothetical protein